MDGGPGSVQRPGRGKPCGARGATARGSSGGRLGTRGLVAATGICRKVKDGPGMQWQTQRPPITVCVSALSGSVCIFGGGGVLSVRLLKEGIQGVFRGVRKEGAEGQGRAWKAPCDLPSGCGWGWPPAPPTPLHGPAARTARRTTPFAPNLRDNVRNKKRSWKRSNKTN